MLIYGCGCGCEYVCVCVCVCVYVCVCACCVYLLDSYRWSEPTADENSTVRAIYKVSVTSAGFASSILTLSDGLTYVLPLVRSGVCSNSLN